MDDLPQLLFPWPKGAEPASALSREWLVTNGLGGYACGTLANCPTRRYHGLFVPSLRGRGRTMMLPRTNELITVGDYQARLDSEQRMDGTSELQGLGYARQFRLNGLIPEWIYDVQGTGIRRRLVMVHGENTLFLQFTHLGGPPAALNLRPFFVMRPHEENLGGGEPMPVLTLHGERISVSTADGQSPPLRMRLFSSRAAPFVSLSTQSPELLFQIERNRGYPCSDTQNSPGYFQCPLQAGESIALGVTVQSEDALDRDPEEAFTLELQRERQLLEQPVAAARTGTCARLVLAADQFIIDPVTRPKDEAWARAIGENARSVIAGYHWFTDWGRDTMISLEGLALVAGRTQPATAILRTFQHYVRDGLLPNLFPEGENEGLYHTADATLWYFHAIDRVLAHTQNMGLLRDLFPTLQDIVQHHLRGTRFGIGVDPADGLLKQGEAGYQLTWMDAKVENWVVTPRRGKAVEINSLWFNALALMAEWSTALGQDSSLYANEAEKHRDSFNRRFWNPDEDCLFDVVDAENGGNDAAVRPNQVFAISLRHPVLTRDRWSPVLEKVKHDLLTPYGLRTLSPSHPDYKSKYDGDRRDRDAAYHQGTVWPWLIGHFIDAWLKLHPDKAAANAMLTPLHEHLMDACVGQVSEVFDAAEPYRPRGCVAQAWSVAELLRASLSTQP